METDNTSATGYINGTIKQKRTKAMDMLFTGSRINNKSSLKFTGAQVFKIWRIISQNTIRQRITEECETYTSTPTNDR
jgi:hypothetical protein